MEYKTREEIPEKYKWDLSSRYENLTEWDKDYELLKSEINIVEKYKDHLFDSPNNLFEGLENKFKIEQRLMKLYCYVILILDENLENNGAISRVSLAQNLFSEYNSLSSFYEPEILDNSDKVKEFINSYPQLKKYEKHLKDIIRNKDHILSEKEESLISNLSSVTSVFEQTNSTLLNSEFNYGTTIDEDGNEVEINSNNIRKLLKSKNRDLRKDVYYKVAKTRAQFKNTLANQLASNMQFENKISKIRKFNDVMDMTFFNEDIDIKVNQTLYTVVNNNISSFQKYLNFMKESLRVEDLKAYDLNVNPFENKKEYTVEEMQQIIIDALSVLGENYTYVLKKAFEDRWIDYFGYKGKTSMVYCLLNYGDTPAIMAHVHGSMEDVSTLAHELGHAVNSYYMFENNDYHTAHNENIRAEIASLTNEVLLTEYIINNTDDKELKKSFIFRMIDTIQNNLFDACLEGELENNSYKLLAEGKSLTANDLGNMVMNLKDKYYGGKVTLDEYSSYSWASRSHYFSPFYLYQYAVSICCACYVAKKILNGEDKMIEKYLDFLKLGNQNNCVDSVKTLGIDLLDYNVYDEAIKYFDGLIDRLEDLK